MGSAFFQTTLFWVFTLDYRLKLDYLPKPNNYNYLINSYLNANQSNFWSEKKKGFNFLGSWSQKWKCVCFLITNLEKEQFEKICKSQIEFVS